MRPWTLFLSAVILIMCLGFAGSASAGALVAQAGGPAVSGDGKPDDWGAPRLRPSGKPTDWDALYKPTGRPEDWGSPNRLHLSTSGRPTDWESPESFGNPRFTLEGRPTDWDSPYSFANPWAFLLKSLRWVGRAF